MSSAERPPGDEPASTGRLDSWKEIAAYLRRSVRSARRWEKEEGLPVHRHLHSKRDSVYAYRSELDEWWTRRGAQVAEQNAEETVASPPETVAYSGDSSDQPGALADEAGRRSLRPRRRAALIGVGFALAVLVVGGVAWLSRSGSRAGTGGTPRALRFQARDWVLVTNLENRTREKLLDGTLDYALGRELSNSHQFSVVGRDRVNDALRLMRKPPDTPIDSALAREVCLRDGAIRAVVTGRVERVGSRYVLSVEIVDPKGGAAQAGFSEESDSAEGSLAALRHISDRIRSALGETPVPDEGAEAGLAKVTTANLRALQLYSRADLMMRQEGFQAAAEELLRQAVAEDPAFASAWIHLAWTVRNRNRPLTEIQPYAETAMHLADTTTERERYFIRGSFYDLLGKRQEAIAAYEALLDLYPDHSWAANNLCHLYDWLHNPLDLEKAVRVEARLADARPNDFAANASAAFDFVAVRPERARAEPYLRRASELVTPEVRDQYPVLVDWIELLPFTENWVKGDLTAAAVDVDRAATNIDLLAGISRDYLAVQTAFAYLTLGRIAAAAETSAKIVDPVVRNDMLAQLDYIKGGPTAIHHPLQFRGDRETRRVSEGFWETVLSLQVRAGITSDADRYQKAQHWDDEESNWLRGEIALEQGDSDVAIRELEETWRSTADRTTREGGPTYCLGREVLAEALAKRGDGARAIQVLERDADRFSAVIGGTTGAYWLRNRWQLAKLYRGAGRVNDAQAIEADLSKLLALADPDHPILVRLRELSRS